MGTFKGAHTGSVLCLKFEKDWDREWREDEDSDAGMGCASTGFMVSGSSDCTVRVWDLQLGPLIETDNVSILSDEPSAVQEDGERQVRADLRATLKGHSGGVLDLRIDRRWIVSWWVNRWYQPCLSVY